MSESERSPKKKKRSFLNRLAHSFRKKFTNPTDVSDNEKRELKNNNEKYKENSDTSTEASCSKYKKTIFNDSDNKIYSKNNTIHDNDDSNRQMTVSVTMQNSKVNLLSVKNDVELKSNEKKVKKFISKEKRRNNDDTSSDSDYSTTDTSDSSDDEIDNEQFLSSEKNDFYLKSDYFTKGKYMTYFFLQMEKMNYNPYDVYSIIRYHDSETAGERKKKIQN